MITYILHVILFSFGFWLIYHFLFRKETFFNTNRMFLLIAPVLAIALPLMSLDFLRINLVQNKLVRVSNQFLDEIIIDAQSDAPILNQNDSVFTLNNLLLGIYLLGVLISLVLFLRNFFKLLQLKKGGEIVTFAGKKVVVLPNRKDAFTFLNTIFIGAEVSETEKQIIVAHEKVHLLEKHSWDLLYFEMLKIVGWFNPFFYLFQKNIAEIHEFIADKETAKIQDKTTYTEMLLNTAFDTRHFSFTNLFFNNQTFKTRIMMLHQSKSTRISKLKYLLSIPLIMLMLTYVSCSNDEIDQDNNATEQIPPPPPVPPAPKSNQDEGEDIYPFPMVSTPPEFMEAGTFGNAEEATADFQQRIQQHVLEHFNTDLADESSGEIRINTQFAITAKGEVTEIRVRSSQKELEKEAVRVIELLPQMKPAKMEENPVKVIYQLPIIFQQVSTGKTN